MRRIKLSKLLLSNKRTVHAYLKVTYAREMFGIISGDSYLQEDRIRRNAVFPF